MRNFRYLIVLLLAVCTVGFAAHAQTPVHKTPSVYIKAQKDFTTDLDAAFIKKRVPVVITEDKVHATYVLQVSAVKSHHVKAGGQLARCLFADCIGMDGSSSVSVSLIRNDTSAVLWAYQVRKGFGGPRSYQSLSEAIAKHLKTDYFRHHPNG